MHLFVTYLQTYVAEQTCYVKLDSALLSWQPRVTCLLMIVAVLAGT